MTDLQLVQQTLGGDQQAYSALVLKYQDYMYTVCLNMLKSKPDAQEATQDTFIKAYKKLDSYKDASKLSSWLYKIAYRTCLDMIRKRKQTIDIDEVYNLSDQGYDVQNNIEKDQMHETLNLAIMNLRPKEAALIQLYYLEEMSVKEISKSLEINLSAVKVNLFRARKKLLCIVQDQFSELENYLT